MARKIKKEVFLTADGTPVYIDEFSVKRLMQMVTRADIVNMSTNVTKEGVWFTYSTNYSHGSIFLNNLGK